MNEKYVFNILKSLITISFQYANNMNHKLLSIMCLSCLPFIFTLNGDFVFDDSEAIIKNKDIFTESWTTPFLNDFWGTDIKSNLSHKSYRPLTILTFRINCLLNNGTLNAFQFKLANLICHMICCILLWKALEIITDDTRQQDDCHDTGMNKIWSLSGKMKKWWTDTPFLATILFSVHPIHVEAVCGIVGRADLLAAITFFITFICYHRSMTSHGHQYIYLLATVVISGVSMLCKENGVTVLGFCLVYEITKFKVKRKETLNTGKLSVRMGGHVVYLCMESLIRMLVVVMAIIGLLYVRWAVMGETKPEFKPTENPAAYAETLFSKIATYNYIYFLNLLLLVWPQWLCYDWSMGCIPLIENYTDIRIIPVLLMYLYGILLLKTIMNCKTWKSNSRLLVLAVSMIVIPFLPAANIFYPVGFVIAERILYIPSAGYCLLIVIGFNKLLQKRNLFGYKIGVFMFLLLLLIYTVRSWQRSIDWLNEYNLFVSGLSVCPLNAKVRYNIAKVADANHQTTWAMAEYKEAIRLYPEYYQATNNLANLLKNQKQFSEAEFYLRAAVRLKSDFPAAWMNLGIVLANTGRFGESESAYKTALSHRRKYPDCFYNLGNLYLEMNKTEDAITSWFQAINLKPKHVLAWTNLMALLDNTGQIERALKIIPRVMTELPEAPSINFAIANMYGKINRYGEAEAHFMKAIRLFDKEVQAIHYANLGVLYHRWKKYNLAEKMYKNALKIDPTFKTAHRNLENLRNMHT